MEENQSYRKSPTFCFLFFKSRVVFNQKNNQGLYRKSEDISKNPKMYPYFIYKIF